ELDARGGLDRDGVGVAERELDSGALRGDAVAGADDLEALLVALGHTDDVVRDERAGQAVERTRVALVIGTGHEDLPVFDLRLDGLRDGQRELTLRALDGHVLAVDVDLDAGRDAD